MKISNVELEFDFNDADDMEKLENAIEKTQKNLNELKTDNKKTSEVIRETCKSVFNCLTGISINKYIISTYYSNIIY